VKWILLLAAVAPLMAADPQAEVRAAVESWKQAVLNKDAPALDRLLHPDLTYSHSDGRTQTKADILKTMAEFKAITFGENTVRVYGNTALMKGPVDFFTNSSGAQSTIHLDVLQVWLKGETGWQLVARQSTRLNPAP